MIKDRALISAIVDDLRIPKLPTAPCGCQPVATAEFRAGDQALLAIGTTRNYYWHDQIRYQWPKQFGPEFGRIFPPLVKTLPMTRVATRASRTSSPAIKHAADR